MSDELIEAVARALYAHVWRKYPEPTFEFVSDHVRDVHRADARIALAAIEASGFKIIPSRSFKIENCTIGDDLDHPKLWGKP